MKDEKETPESPVRVERKPRPAPRTSVETAPPQSAETQQLLNAILADEFVLYVRSLNFHWNVKGMQFHSLHKFFEELYEAQAKTVDDVAEKVRALGGTAMGTMEEYLGNSRLREKIGEPPDPRVMVSTLASDHGTLIRHLRQVVRRVRERYDDPSTDNFLCDLLEKHEKTLWMLQAHLDRELG